MNHMFNAELHADPFAAVDAAYDDKLSRAYFADLRDEEKRAEEAEANRIASPICELVQKLPVHQVTELVIAQLLATISARISSSDWGGIDHGVDAVILLDNVHDMLDPTPSKAREVIPGTHASLGKLSIRGGA